MISRRDTVVIDTNAALWDELGHSGAECDIGQVGSSLDLGIAHSGQVEEIEDTADHQVEVKEQGVQDRLDN